MRLASLLGPDLKEMLRADPEEVREALAELHSEDVAELIEELPLEDAVAVIRALDEERAADVLESVAAERQEDIFERLSIAEAAELLSEMDPDDRVDAVQELEEELAQSLLKHLDEHEPEVAEEVRELVKYEETTAGGLMTPDYVSLAPETKVWQAIEEVRRLSREDEVETIYYIYVVAFGKLVGVVSLRDLILKDPGMELGHVMTEKVVRVQAHLDQEEVARTMAKYDLSAIPVVDGNERMLGVVTVDDVVDVVIEEATEDAQRMGAVSPIDEGYFETSFFRFFRSRVVWLIVLFFGGLLTASVMERYQGQLSRVIELAVFIPLIISSGGNAGSQSASLVIRALAVGDVQPRDWLKVLVRESATGLALGITLGLLGYARVFFLGEAHEVIPMAMTVSTSILAVVLMGSLVGSLLPIGIQRVGLDPAVSSTPFIASLVDVLGLLVYLNIARFFLHIA